MNRLVRIAAALALLASAAVAAGGAAKGATPEPQFGKAVKLPNTETFNEPRVWVDGLDRRWVIASEKDTWKALVFRSDDGGRSYNKLPDFAQPAPTPDVDVVVTRTGRIIVSELDSGNLVPLGLTKFVTSYSDDDGKTWTRSTGMVPADVDRQWMAVGPDDPVTHQPRVYLLFHNLLSGAVIHGMFVQTSTDGGASFGVPVAVTPPTSQAFLDLQCADSGGPSSLSVNPKTGQLYAVFGTRGSPVAGGCGATVTDGAEINIVRATRVWVATSPDNSLGSWTTSMAVDNASTGKIVGLQLSYGALDSAGNVYVAYPESKSKDDLTAAVKLVHAPPDLSAWSKPVTVADTGAGHALVHIAAGDPGRVVLGYFKAKKSGDDALWYSVAAQSLDALSGSPHFTETELAPEPAYKGSVDSMEGRCSEEQFEAGPAAGVIDGLACGRFSDVYGITLDRAGRAIIVWPGQAETKGVLAGAYVSTQTGGPTLVAAATQTASPTVAPDTTPATGGTERPWVAVLLLALLVAAAAGGRRLVRRA
jgi:hypothetical protein